MYKNLFGEYFTDSRRNNIQKDIFEKCKKNLLNIGIIINKELKSNISYHRLDSYIDDHEKGKIKKEFILIIRKYKGILSIFEVKGIIDDFDIFAIFRRGDKCFEIQSKEVDKILYNFILKRYIIDRNIVIFKKSNSRIKIRGRARFSHIDNWLKMGIYNVNGLNRNKDYINYKSKIGIGYCINTGIT